MAKTGLIIALDTQDPLEAEKWALATDNVGHMIKLGMEFTYACGLDAVRTLARGRRLFLDLKLHDIPNTVSAAIKSLESVRPAMLTIHTLGGYEMIQAARKAIDESFPPAVKPLLLGVTVLTSMDEQGLNEIGIRNSPMEEVVCLGKMAIQAGVDGLVCSPVEIARLRQELGKEPKLVVPGIRMKNAETHDQKRVMSPAEAHRAGADWVVVGRPITRAADPEEAAKAIVREMQDHS